jgi:hypothetical protein
MKRSLVALFLLFLAFPLVGGPGPKILRVLRRWRHVRTKGVARNSIRI